MTIRIDTLRNTLAGTRRLLDMIGEEIEDLHVLAYDRQAARQEAKVSGGTADWALDTHGDQRARQAYRDLAEAVDQACVLLDDAIYDALNLLREGPSSMGRAPRRLRLVELGEAIASQVKRTRRGEYEPIRRGIQPDAHNALAEITKERDTLNRALTETRKELDREKQRNRSTRGPSTR